MVEYDIEAEYRKVWSERKRPLDIAYVNFIVNNFRKGKVLDVGCGFGELLGVIREFGFDCFGTVASHYETDECVRKGLKVQFHDASTKLPFDDNSFDILLSIGSIEHIQGWQNALKEMNRVLINGGTLIVETPNHSVFRKSKKYADGKEEFDIVHFKEFEFDELKKELEACGFGNVKAHDKWFYYPNHYFLKAFDNFSPKKGLPYLFFSAVKKQKSGE